MELLVIVLSILLGFGALAWFLNRRLQELSESSKPSNDLLEYLKTTNIRMDEQNKNISVRLDRAAEVISHVQKNIGEMSEIGRSMRDLQEFLQSPKLRGNVGEQVLNELLRQMLPENSFHLQYSFKTGDKVDAAIKTSAGMIPIDSKFPMENFRAMMAAEDDKERASYKKLFERDVKRHIDAIGKKYILTDEGTIDYALMYIPSEAVYYEVVNSPSLFEYSGDKRVLPVSPTTFYAYMRAILMSFEGQKIEAKAQEVLSSIRAVQKDYKKVEDNLSTLGRHLGNANNMMANVFESFGLLGRKLDNTKRLGEKIDKIESD